MLSDQDTGFENKARVRKLPLQVFTAPDAQKLETEKQNKKETEASLNADNDTYNGLECSQEQIELVLREKEKILEEARKEAAAIEQEANEKAEQIFEEARMKGFEEGRQKGYEAGLIRAEEENEAKHRENQRFFKESLEKALIEINKEKEKCLREYLEELKDIAVAVAEKVIHISLRSSGSVISRMIEAETEKLQKMDWVKIYMEKEDYETMVQADGHLAEKLSRLSDNVKFIVMEDGKCGSCIIEMPDGIIDMSVDTQLENIHRLVDNANT